MQYKLQKLLEIGDIGKIPKKSVFYVLISLYVLSIAYYMREYSLWTQVWGYMYDHSMSVIFAPIYEEILFRGIVLIWLLQIFKNKTQVVVWWWILFGLWHLKNFPFQSIWETIHQVIYTMFLGFLFTYLALKYKTVWLWVILHYVNNIFLSPVSWAFIAFISKTV